MKHLFFFFMLLVCAAASSRASANKKALVIGIGAYKAGNGWNTLHGDADVQLIESSLIKTGFEQANIITISNSRATKQGITHAMNELLSKCQPGDVIVFHFSGHGQQIQDMNGDEADGLDEALIPYDAPAVKISSSYDGSLHLTDDELGVWFDKIRTKIGSRGQLIVFLDACHSGTASRGTTVERGGMPPLILSAAAYKAKPDGEERNQSGYVQVASARGNKDKGRFVMFSAAQADKSDYEYENKIGSLTYAVADALNNKIQTPALSFRDLFEYIRNTLARIVPYQQPELEGDKDITLFGGDMVVQEPYFYVQQVRDKEITISGGTLVHMEKGAVVGFYPAGTRSRLNIQPIAKGKVVKANTFTSVVLLDRAYHPDSIGQYRAMMMQEGTRDRRTKVFIAPDVASAFRETLSDTLLAGAKQVLLVTGKEEADIVITSAGKENQIHVVTARENADIINPVDMTQPATVYSCDGNSRSENALSYIFSTIKNYSVNSILKAADFSSDEYGLKMELLPAELDDNNRIVKVLPDTNNAPVVTAHSTSCLRITNTGNTEGYITVIEFNPSGAICLLKGVLENIKLAPGKSYSYPVTGFSPPYGRYIMKAFITANPISNELNLVINQQSGVRGSTDGIVAMLGSMLDNPASARTMSVGGTSGSTITYSYQLINQ